MVPSGQRREPRPEISKCGLPEAAGSVLKLPLLTLSPGAGTLRASACSSSACPQGPPSWLPSESLTTAQLLLPCYSGVVCLPWHCFLCPLEGEPREDEPGTCQCTSEHRGSTGTPQATSWCRQVEMRLRLWVQGRWPRAAGKGVLQGVFQGGEVGGSAGL